MKLNYEKLLGYPLSSLDIMDMMNNKTKIVTYSDLCKYKNIDDLLTPYENIILIYETSPNFGHWVCLFKTPRGNIEFFDSYGLMVDDEKTFISKSFLNKSGQKHNYLSKLLYECEYPLEYNDKCLQSEEPQISTCGRWCVTRILSKHMKLNDFIKKYINNGDIKVIDFTQKLINNLN